MSGNEIRLVVLTRSLFRTRFEGMARAGISPFAAPAEMGRAARDLLLSHGFGGSAAVIGMDSEAAMLRRVVFPFRSPGKIARVLRLELESVMPGPLADKAVSCLPAGSDGPDRPGLLGLFAQSGSSGRHAYLAAAVPTKDIERHREAFSALDPEALDLDLTGLWRTAEAVERALADPPPAARGGVAALRGLLALRPEASQTGPVLAVDVEPGRALLVLCARGQPRRARQASLAGMEPGGGEWLAELCRQVVLTLAAEPGFGPARVLLFGGLADSGLAARWRRVWRNGRDRACAARCGARRTWGRFFSPVRTRPGNSPRTWPWPAAWPCAAPGRGGSISWTTTRPEAPWYARPWGFRDRPGICGGPPFWGPGWGW